MIKSTILICMILLVTPASAITLNDTQNAINESNTNWSAKYSGDHTLTKMSDLQPKTNAYFSKFFWDGVQRPDNYDMRNEGLVTPVKNQRSCGSCWAFAAVATMETTILKEHGITLDLAEQHLVDDCSSSGNCYGGSAEMAMFYICDRGIDLEEFYPYRANHGDCRLSEGYQDRRWESVCMRTPAPWLHTDRHIDDAIQQGLMTFGGAVVCINVQEDFVYYSRGIYTPLIGRGVNHAVELVGWHWTGNPSTSYWIIKNSWGTHWGEQGYGKITWQSCIDSYDSMYFPNQTYRTMNPCEIYDINKNEIIDLNEIINAINDYFNYIITIAETIAVLDCYYFNHSVSSILSIR